MTSETPRVLCHTCYTHLTPDQTICPVCQTPISQSWVECSYCKVPVRPQEGHCPRCRRAISIVPAESGGSHVIPPSSPFVSLVQDPLPDGPEALGPLPIGPGDRLGDSLRYTVKGTLGTGGFGTVYLVHDAVLNEEIALKVVASLKGCKVGAGHSDLAREQLLNEFKFRRQINDTRHIIKSWDPRWYDFQGLSLFLLPMELADGGSFRQWLATHPNDPERSKWGLPLFLQTCLGVKALHEAGLVHLDLKPENILLVDEMAKIADFGIGRYSGHLFRNIPETTTLKAGTPQYMSPEQFLAARKKEIGSASDIYSLGIILFEILDGTLPFEGSYEELREKHRTMSYPRLDHRPDVDLWNKILSRCLAKDPQKRYPTIDFLIKDLDHRESGAVLSVDAACPNCGHLNVNPDLKCCEQCRSDLILFFHVCPECQKPVRMDVDICSFCQYQVGAYYLFLQRKAQIEEWRETDPESALELLGRMLRGDIRDYRETALATVRDLRRKLGLIGPAIVAAEKAATLSNPEQAISAWQKVLEVFPLHRRAKAMILDLEQIWAAIQDFLTFALKHIKKAEFSKAFDLLEECLNQYPACSKAKEMIEQCKRWEIDYVHAFKLATTALENGDLTAALGHVKQSLSVCSLSPAALSLKKTIHQEQKKAIAHLRHAREALLAAQFNRARQQLKIAQSTWTTLQDKIISQEIINHTAEEFGTAYQEAWMALQKRQFDKAKERCLYCLSLCPHAKNAHKLMKLIQTTQERLWKNQNLGLNFLGIVLLIIILMYLEPRLAIGILFLALVATLHHTLSGTLLFEQVKRWGLMPSHPVAIGRFLLPLLLGSTLLTLAGRLVLSYVAYDMNPMIFWSITSLSLPTIIWGYGLLSPGRSVDHQKRALCLSLVVFSFLGFVGMATLYPHPLDKFILNQWPWILMSISGILLLISTSIHAMRSTPLFSLATHCTNSYADSVAATSLCLGLASLFLSVASGIVLCQYQGISKENYLPVMLWFGIIFSALTILYALGSPHVPLNTSHFSDKKTSEQWS